MGRNNGRERPPCEGPQQHARRNGAQSLLMTGQPSAADNLIPVFVEIRGCTDTMDQQRLALIEELPEYLAREGLRAEICFREPGGMGPTSVLESIDIFVRTQTPGVVYGMVIEETIRAASRALGNWSRARRALKSMDDDPDRSDGEGVINGSFYGQTGRLMKWIPFDGIHQEAAETEDDA